MVKAGCVVSSARSLGVFCARAPPASKTAIAKTSDKLFFIDFSLVRIETGRRSSGLVLRTGGEEKLALTEVTEGNAVRIPKNLPGRKTGPNLKSGSSGRYFQAQARFELRLSI